VRAGANVVMAVRGPGGPEAPSRGRVSVPGLNPPVRLALRVESDDLPALEFQFPDRTVRRTVTAGTVLPIAGLDPRTKWARPWKGSRPKFGANGRERFGHPGGLQRYAM
jgi:hypothetical protein